MHTCFHVSHTAATKTSVRLLQEALRHILSYLLPIGLSMIGKIISWLMNDIIVNALAKSKRFQRFALKIDDTLNKNKKVITEDYMKTGEALAKEKLAKAKETKLGIFATVFMEEMKKEGAKGKTAIKK